MDIKVLDVRQLTSSTCVHGKLQYLKYVKVKNFMTWLLLNTSSKEYILFFKKTKYEGLLNQKYIFQ